MPSSFPSAGPEEGCARDPEGSELASEEARFEDWEEPASRAAALLLMAMSMDQKNMDELGKVLGSRAGCGEVVPRADEGRRDVIGQRLVRENGRWMRTRACLLRKVLNLGTEMEKCRWTKQLIRCIWTEADPDSR